MGKPRSNALEKPKHCREGHETLILLACVVLSVLAAVSVAVMPVPFWIDSLLVGDATAYPIVAANIMRGEGATYDGITKTNGFHPLWLVLQLPLMVGAAPPMERIWLVKLLMVVTVLLAALVWGRVIRMYTENRLAGGIMLGWLGASGWSLFVLYSGMETPLVVLLMGASLLAADKLTWSPSARGQRSSMRNAGLLGLLMGLCFLARLDSIFFLVPLGLCVLPALVRQGWIEAATWAGSGLFVTLPYILWNYLGFGSTMPVSGLVKTYETVDVARSVLVLQSDLSKIRLLLPFAIQPLFPFLLVVLLGLAVILAVAVYRRLPRRKPFNLLVLLPVSAILHFAYYFLRIRELLVPWHVYPQILLVFAAISCLPLLAIRTSSSPSNCSRSATAVSAAIIVVLVASTIGYAWMKQKRQGERQCSYIAAEWLSDIPAGSRLAMYDGWYVQLLAGPEYHILDLTGLVTDRETALLAKAEDFRQIVEKHQIEYVLGWENVVSRLAPTLIKRQQTTFFHKTRPFALGKTRPVEASWLGVQEESEGPVR